MIQKMLQKQIETFYSSGRMKSCLFQTYMWKSQDQFQAEKHLSWRDLSSHGDGSAPVTEEPFSSPECSVTSPCQCSQKCEQGWDRMRNFVPLLLVIMTLITVSRLKSSWHAPSQLAAYLIKGYELQVSAHCSNTIMYSFLYPVRNGGIKWEFSLYTENMNFLK